MFKLSKLIKNLIFLLIFVQQLFARTQEQSLSEAQKPQGSQQRQKTSFFNFQNFNFKEKRIFSLDTAYLLSGLKNNGWGLGLAYEQLLFPFLSIKGDFSHITIFPTSYDVTITTVGISLNTFYYPFNKGLNFLYIGFGCRTDFLMYSGDDVPSDHKKDSLVQTRLGRIQRQVKIQFVQNLKKNLPKTKNLNLGLPATSCRQAFQGYGFRLRTNASICFRTLTFPILKPFNSRNDCRWFPCKRHKRRKQRRNKTCWLNPRGKTNSKGVQVDYEISGLSSCQKSFAFDKVTICIRISLCQI